MKNHNNWNFKDDDTKFFEVLKRILFFSGCLGFCVLTWIFIIMFLTYAQDYGVL